jgi:hypothetical protein
VRGRLSFPFERGNAAAFDSARMPRSSLEQMM